MGVRLECGVPFRLPVVPFFLTLFFLFFPHFPHFHLLHTINQPFYSGKSCQNLETFVSYFLPHCVLNRPTMCRYCPACPLPHCCKVRKRQRLGWFIFALLITNKQGII